PLTVDSFNGSPYDFARSVIEHLQSLPGIHRDWHQRLEGLKQATMHEFIGVIEKLKEGNRNIDYSKFQS
ncbi:MAG: hypothetical protein WCQ99_17605, partial [Pseudomonadota bacterium]